MVSYIYTLNFVFSSHDIDEDNVTHRTAMLNAEQQHVFQEVVNSVKDHKSNMFFMDAPGGSGKTYVINTIIDFLRLQGEI